MVNWLIAQGLMLGTIIVLTSFGLSSAKAASEISSLIPNNPAVLDAHRRFALGMIETANKDNAIGLAGEVSRYQIMPSVWRHYNNSQQYQNPSVSLAVAQKHWLTLYATFKKQARREPNDFDMYVLWNTRYGHYARKGFKPDRLSPVVRDRAQRFVNLVRCDKL